MKRPQSTHSVRSEADRGFTLVEMLVVITIIGILAGLTAAAAIAARNRARITAISMELSNLDMAMKAYKEKFGEYPPDFTNTDAVMRHLARVFPRYNPGSWSDFVTSMQSNSNWQQTNPSKFISGNVGPFMALTFWLGGRPDFTSGTFSGFLGFSANPQDPFETTGTSSSRVGPFFDFDLSRVSRDTNHGNGFRYWPTGAVGDESGGAIAYFRAENGVYRKNGTVQGDLKSVTDTDGTVVYPAGDTRIGFNGTTGSNSWINPRSFQILSSGMDVTYGSLTVGTETYPGLAFPTGENYSDHTFDDITNFSKGTLEDAIP